jgi:DNA-binding NarL/FixJ family response regulator
LNLFVLGALTEAVMPGIPAALTNLVDRQREIAEVKRLLSIARLVTLTGAGGVGKTRLALRVAKELHRAFRDGVCVAELVSYAMDENPSPTAASAAPPAQPLTRRELEVAHLIAEGLSNKQIALRLLISQRTAESHVENILRKLGLTSRAQIAAWIAQRDTKD